MFDERFAEAVIHRAGGHRVLGHTLRAFSFWHAFQLDAIRSPFVTAVGRPDFSALYLAVHTCRLRHPQTLAGRWRIWRALQEFSEARFGKPLRFLRERNAFYSYLIDHRSAPQYLETADGELAKCPWYLLHVRQLMRDDPRLTESEAWDFPAAYGQWINAAHTELAGHKIHLITPELRVTAAKDGVAL